MEKCNFYKLSPVKEMAQTFLSVELNLSVAKNFRCNFFFLYEKFTEILLTCFTIFFLSLFLLLFSFPSAEFPLAHFKLRLG